MIRVYAIAAMLTLLLIACGDDPVGNNSPVISYNGMSKDNIVQGSLGLEDTLVIGLTFEDIDGDLDEAMNNIVVIDTRNGEIHYTNTVPDLPESENGNKGQMQISVPTLCCLFDDGTPPCESPPDFPTNEFSFEIYIFDAQGNQSNRVSTPEFTLLCN